MLNKSEESLEMIGPGVTLVTNVPTSREKVFKNITNEEGLSNVLKGYGLIPPVKRTKMIPGPKWGAPGAKRTIYIRNGQVTEELLKVYKPGEGKFCGFKYHIFNFRNVPFRYLVTEGQGEFRLFQLKDGTQIEWSYSFRPKNWFLKLPVKLFVFFIWKPFMQNVIKNIE